MFSFPPSPFGQGWSHSGNSWRGTSAGPLFCPVSFFFSAKTPPAKTSAITSPASLLQKLLQKLLLLKLLQKLFLQKPAGPSFCRVSSAPDEFRTMMGSHGAPGATLRLGVQHTHMKCILLKWMKLASPTLVSHQKNCLEEIDYTNTRALQEANERIKKGRKRKRKQKKKGKGEKRKRGNT